MHIVYITPELSTKENHRGGLGTYISNMSRIMRDNGHDVTLIYVTTKDTYETVDNDINYINLYIKKEDWEIYNSITKIYGEIYNTDKDTNRREIIKLMKMNMVREFLVNLHQDKPIDIIHVPNHGALALLLQSEWPVVVRISGFSNIYFNGGNTESGSLEYFDNPRSFNDYLENMALKKADSVFAPSYLLSKICNECLNIDSNVLESPFIDVSNNNNSASQFEFLKGKQYLLFYGSLRILKGIHIIAELMERFLTEFPNVLFVYAGNDILIPKGKYKDKYPTELIKECAGNHANRVIYLGNLSREELYPVIKNAYACIFPSRIENLSNACIEAMAMGRIVIATNGASFEQLITDGDNGFLCERDNVEDFLKTVIKVFNLTKDERKTISKNAAETTKRLSAEVIYPQYYELCLKTIEKWKNKK